MSLRQRFRSAITGRYVQPETAERWPRQTLGERITGKPRPVVYFGHDDMIAFATAVLTKPTLDVSIDATNARQYVEHRLDQWERGTWPTTEETP